ERARRGRLGHGRLGDRIGGTAEPREEGPTDRPRAPREGERDDGRGEPEQDEQRGHAPAPLVGGRDIPGGRPSPRAPSSCARRGTIPVATKSPRTWTPFRPFRWNLKSSWRSGVDDSIPVISAIDSTRRTPSS